MKQYRLCILGCGAIGAAVARHVDVLDEVAATYLVDVRADARDALAGTLEKAQSADALETCLDSVDIVIECASHAVVRTLVPRALEQGKDVVVMSVGALADEALFTRLRDLGAAHGGRLHIPSGAVAGVDALTAAGIAGIDHVTLTTTKPIAGLRTAPYVTEQGLDLAALSDAQTIFEGSAREAIRGFPENINVAACLSLAGIGFDKTTVCIIADPHAQRNKHEIHATGAFGTLHTAVENVPSPDNARTSYLAALSAVALVKKMVRSVSIGT